jgi:small-conductance mechanosensitive channel
VVTGAASSARMPAARRLGRLVEIAIWVGTSLVAVEQLGIEISFLKATLTVALAALLGGAAIAFGLGGQRVAANILSAHYVQKLYQVGQTIRLDGIEGRIARITETAVILESEEGEVAIPASAITEGRSLLVLKPGGR